MAWQYKDVGITPKNANSLWWRSNTRMLASRKQTLIGYVNKYCYSSSDNCYNLTLFQTNEQTEWCQWLKFSHDRAFIAFLLLFANRWELVNWEIGLSCFYSCAGLNLQFVYYQCNAAEHNDTDNKAFKRASSTGIEYQYSYN